MGRFGLTSLGHGAFTGIGAYASVLLWNYPRADALARHPDRASRSPPRSRLLVGYPCFRLRITGHYFALLTLALTEFVRLCIVGLARLHRRLARHPAARATATASRSTRCSSSPTACSSYYIALALWLFGLYVWLRVDRSMDRYALDAASQDEDAAASRRHRRDAREAQDHGALGRRCARSAAPSTRQYQMYIGPDTIAGLGVSLNIVFAVIAGGMWTLLGPTVGAVFTQLLAESLRVGIQGSATPQETGSARRRSPSTPMIYGLLLILFIIYMPKGILGTIMEWRGKTRRRRDYRQLSVAKSPAMSRPRWTRLSTRMCSSRVW